MPDCRGALARTGGHSMRLQPLSSDTRDVFVQFTCYLRTYFVIMSYYTTVIANLAICKRRRDRTSPESLWRFYNTRRACRCDGTTWLSAIASRLPIARALSSCRRVVYVYYSLTIRAQFVL